MKKTYTLNDGYTNQKIYVMEGFEEAKPWNKAYLKIDKCNSNNGIYNIVKDIKHATKFPTINDCNIKGFGTPYQWA